jgi:hypothetical protein
MKKLPAILLTVVPATMGLGVVFCIAIIKAIEEAHDDELFWE